MSTTLQQALEQLSQNKIYNPAASAPPTIKKHLSGNTIADAMSVKAFIQYTSLSGNDQEREVIIRRILKSGRYLFIDAFCTAINAPRLIKVDQITSIEDITTHHVYTDPIRFIEQRLGITIPQEMRNGAQEQTFLDDELLTAMRLTRAEMTALMFFARADHDLAACEIDTVVEYVHKRCMHLTFKDSDLKAYLMTLVPDPESFNIAIRQIVQKEPWILQLFIEYMMHLIAKDQKITPEESELAQRVVALAVEQGYEIEYEKGTN